jgi:phage terminase large subunit-like protein
MPPTPKAYPQPLAQRTAAELLTYPPEVLEQLRYEWDLWALPHQLPPAWVWDTWLNIGGRGSGKTTGATQYIRRADAMGVRRFNFIGRTAASIRDDMVRGEAGIMAAYPPHERPEYISSQSVVRFRSGAEALLLTAEEPAAIQGKNAEVTWLDEFSTYGARAEEVWTQVVLATRVGDPKKLITTNSQPENPFLWKLIAEAEQRRIAVTQSTSFDNFANLPPAYQRQVEEMMRTAWGRAWILGQRFESEGALWKRAWFRYLPTAPTGGRTVVGVDPAGTDDGDETGIVVAKRVGDLGYVLEDLSGNHDPEKWPAMVVDAARRHRDKAGNPATVVIERNRGLNFLRALIRPLDRTVPLKEVYSTRSKDDRALPVANLYELGRIFHIGKHERLEDQQTSWDPKSQATQRAKRKATSPDRIDALVHAITELRFGLGLVRQAGGADLPSSLHDLDDE